MKKRFAAIAVVIVLLVSLCANVCAVEARAQQVFPMIYFSGTTANCSVSVYGDNEIKVTLELKNGTKLVDSWSDSGTNYVMLSGSHMYYCADSWNEHRLVLLTGKKNGNS